MKKKFVAYKIFQSNYSYVMLLKTISLFPFSLNNITFFMNFISMNEVRGWWCWNFSVLNSRILFSRLLIASFTLNLKNESSYWNSKKEFNIILLLFSLHKFFFIFVTLCMMFITMDLYITSGMSSNYWQLSSVKKISLIWSIGHWSLRNGRDQVQT